MTHENIELSSSNSAAISCYETSSLYIICFYKNQYKQYTIGVFSLSLVLQNTEKVNDGNDNEKIFFKCAHFYGEIGAFVYYSNDNVPSAIMEFKKYDSNQFTDYYSKISFDEYSFYYNLTLNDIIKVFDKKIYYVAVSLNKLNLFKISIYNYDQDKIMKRIYKTNSFAHN